MTERLSELQAKVQKSRQALEAMASRTAEVRDELASAWTGGQRPREAGTHDFAHRSSSWGAGTASGSPSAADAALVASLERLAQVSSDGPTVADMADGGDGEFISEAWEIALINE